MPISFFPFSHIHCATVSAKNTGVSAVGPKDTAKRPCPWLWHVEVMDIKKGTEKNKVGLGHQKELFWLEAWDKGIVHASIIFHSASGTHPHTQFNWWCPFLTSSTNKICAAILLMMLMGHGQEQGSSSFLLASAIQLHDDASLSPKHFFLGCHINHGHN